MKLEDNKKILNEKIYGGLATVYHGSQHGYNLFYKERFKPGNGAGSMYGDGIYSVYDSDKLSNTMRGTYGSTIIKMVASTYRVVNFNTLYKIFDNELLKNGKQLGNLLEEVLIDSKYHLTYEKMLNEPTDTYDIKDYLTQPEIKNPLFNLFIGLETIFLEPLTKMGFDTRFYNEFITWMNKIGWFWFSKTFYYVDVKAKALHTSRIAKPFTDDFYDYLCGNGTKELINGIIFVGANDGPVMVIYNLNNYIPIAHYEKEKYNPNEAIDESKWQQIPKNEQSEFLKKQKEYFSKYRFGQSKSINVSKQSEDEKVLYHILQKFLAIKNKKLMAPVADTVNLSFVPFLALLKKFGKTMFDIRNLMDVIFAGNTEDENNIYKDFSDSDLGVVDDFIRFLDPKAIDYFFNNFDTAHDFTAQYLPKVVKMNFNYFYKAVVEYNILDTYINNFKSNTSHPIINLFDVILSESISYRQKLDSERERVESILMFMIKNTPEEHHAHIHAMALVHKRTFYSIYFLTLLKERNINFPIDFIYVAELMIATGEINQLFDLIYDEFIDLKKYVYDNAYDNENIPQLIPIFHSIITKAIKSLDSESYFMINKDKALFVLTKSIMLPCINFLLDYDPEYVNKNTNNNEQSILDIYIRQIHILPRKNITLSEEDLFTINSFIHILNKLNIFMNSHTINYILEDVFVTSMRGYRSKQVSVLLPTVTNQLTNYPEVNKNFVDVVLYYENDLKSTPNVKYTPLIPNIMNPKDTYGYYKETVLIQNYIWSILNSDKNKYQHIIDELNNTNTETEEDLEESANYFYL